MERTAILKEMTNPEGKLASIPESAPKVPFSEAWPVGREVSIDDERPFVTITGHSIPRGPYVVEERENRKYLIPNEDVAKKEKRLYGALLPGMRVTVGPKEEKQTSTGFSAKGAVIPRGIYEAFYSEVPDASGKRAIVPALRNPALPIEEANKEAFGVDFARTKLTPALVEKKPNSVPKSPTRTEAVAVQAPRLESRLAQPPPPKAPQVRPEQAPIEPWMRERLEKVKELTNEPEAALLTPELRDLLRYCVKEGGIYVMGHFYPNRDANIGAGFNNLANAQGLTENRTGAINVANQHLYHALEFERIIGGVEALTLNEQKFPGGRGALQYHYTHDEYKDATTSKRRGSIMEITVTLPPDKVRLLFENFSKHPENVRSFFTALSFEVPGAEQLWNEDQRPPFAVTDVQRKMLFIINRKHPEFLATAQQKTARVWEQAALPADFKKEMEEGQARAAFEATAPKRSMKDLEAEEYKKKGFWQKVWDWLD